MVAAVWALVTAWGAIWSGHFSYWLLYIALLGVGAWALLRGTQERKRKTWLTILGGVGTVLLALVGWWLRPFPADPVALAALDEAVGYTVESDLGTVSLWPDSPDGIGLIFQPGARVDARAYASLLSELARAGHPVVIVKQPLGIGFLALGAPESIADLHSQREWAVGGHSLGGVAASASAGDGLDNLLLWASFPASAVEETVRSMSITASEDSFTTPEDVDDTRDRLPADTEFVVIEGGIHSFFGDYGLQPGDGDPSVSREEAQRQIVEASLRFLDAR